ncbi:MAG: DUF3795 domain-containing protein [Deltaproteobacteria bacterium]|nr:DUF3795 domain-containing protein [Deltaproteobacteria bacterium]MBW2118130.1 DUF3795 domain-containing protein [Deltaproteobacteria bacterium]MBW2343685.1 DUF3795 domain-containing protein [Deltaproteobacteria bacterium]
MKKDSYQPDKKLSAVCGLFCPACIIFIAQGESPERRKKIAKNLKISVEDLQCDGCRAEKRFSYCDTCKLEPCAAEKGLDFCGECDEYPCGMIREFQAAMPHRIELWENNARIREVGCEKWFEEMLEHYSCPKCNTLNSAYHRACRECGDIPSCSYVDLHSDEIKSYLSNTQRESSE